MQRQQQNRQGAAKNMDIKDDAEDSAPLLSLGSVARQELLLERLPYMAHMLRARKSSRRLRDIEKVVSFQGVAPADEEPDADEDQVSGEAWATDKPSEEASPRKKSTVIKAGGVSGLLAQKLVLSDDDIED